MNDIRRIPPPAYEGLSIEEKVNEILNYLYQKDEAERAAEEKDIQGG